MKFADSNASNQAIARKCVVDEFDSDLGVVDADKGNDGYKVMKLKVEAEEEVAHQPIAPAGAIEKTKVVTHQPKPPPNLIELDNTRYTL